MGKIEEVKMEEYIVEDEFVNLRLDKVISEKAKDYSRVAIQRLIEEGNILVNGKKAKPSYKLQKADKIFFKKPELKEAKIEEGIQEINNIISSLEKLGITKEEILKKVGK